jgi:hypothetical protein
MFSSLGTSNKVGFFNRLCEVLEPCSKGTYSTFGTKSTMTKAILADSFSSVGLGDPSHDKPKQTYTKVITGHSCPTYLAPQMPMLSATSSYSSQGFLPPHWCLLTPLQPYAYSSACLNLMHYGWYSLGEAWR